MKKDATAGTSEVKVDEGDDEELRGGSEAVCEPVDRMLRELDLIDTKPLFSLGLGEQPTVLSLPALLLKSPVTEHDKLPTKDGPNHGSNSFRCVMDKIPTEYCRSLFRCQQKLRTLRKTLRKTSQQIACATGAVC